MKCPQCSWKMKKLDAAGFKWYCTSPRCVFWKEVILTARAIRAIRRKLKAEYERGATEALKNRDEEERQWREERRERAEEVNP